MRGWKEIGKDYKNIVLLGCIAIVIGILVGAVETLFGKVLLAVTDIRMNAVFLLTPLLPLAGMLIIFTYTKIGKNSIKGMSLLFMVGLKKEDKIPIRLVPLAMGSTWVTHLFGGSAGREGVAVQIGGTIAHSMGRKIHIENSAKIFLITGMAAGFAGLFQTPIAAIFFAMEIIIAGSMEYSALFPCIIASFVASYTSHILGLEKFEVTLNCTINLNWSFIIKIVILGILFGIIGALFAFMLNTCKTFFSITIKNPILRIFSIGCVLSVLLLLFHEGRYSGTGSNLINAAFSQGKIYGYDWILKFILTIVTISIGFQGGEVTPLFSIGACLGAALAPVLGLPVEFVSALGFVSVFGSGTNTILSPIFVGVEVFGYDYLPYFFIVSAIAYVFNGNKSIYSAQKVLSDIK